MIRSVDQRVLVGTAAVLSYQPIDYNGANATPAGTITIGITRADGTQLVAAGTPVGGTTNNPRTYTLSAANNTELQRLTATWTDGTDGSVHTTLIDVVGAYYFSIDELRNFPSLNDATKFPVEKLVEARRIAEELIELATGVAWVPRYEFQRVKGTGTTQLLIDWPQLRAVRGGKIFTSADNFDSLTQTDIDSIAPNELPVANLSNGRFWIKTYVPWQNIEIEYEHGFDAPPADLKDAALQYARYWLLGDSKRISPRALDITNEMGTIRYSQPGEGRPTGIPDVDAVIMLHSRRIPEVA